MGLGYPSAMWYRVLPALVDRYRGVCFDNRGAGRTGPVEGPYEIEQMADDAAAVVLASGAESAHVIGASMGGVIAQELALRRPDLVRSLVLCCTLPNGPESAPPSDEAIQMVADRSHVTPREAAEIAIPFVYAPDTPRASIEEDFDVRMRIPTTATGYTNQALAMLSHRGTYMPLHEIDRPALVVHGTIDLLVNPENARILADRIPNARVEYIEGASHILFTDRPDEVNGVIRRFLDEVSRTR